MHLIKRIAQRRHAPRRLLDSRRDRHTTLSCYLVMLLKFYRGSWEMDRHETLDDAYRFSHNLLYPSLTNYLDPITADQRDATWPESRALTNASSSITGPRAVFTITTPFFIFANSAKFQTYVQRQIQAQNIGSRKQFVEAYVFGACCVFTAHLSSVVATNSSHTKNAQGLALRVVTKRRRR
ncbi:hypothetical protein KCU83_g363, partial [Aureobasidium melanogenum]